MSRIPPVPPSRPFRHLTGVTLPPQQSRAGAAPGQAFFNLQDREAHKREAKRRVRDVFTGANEPDMASDYMFTNDDYLTTIIDKMARAIETAPLMISFKADLFYPAMEDPRETTSIYSRGSTWGRTTGRIRSTTSCGPGSRTPCSDMTRGWG